MTSQIQMAYTNLILLCVYLLGWNLSWNEVCACIISSIYHGWNDFIHNSANKERIISN